MMNNKQFWGRLVLYVLFGALIPVAFLIWRFNLFTKTEAITIGGWGLVAVIFIAVFFMKTMKSVERGLEFSIGVQCLNGVRTIVLPLIIAAFCVYYMQDVMEQLFQFLCVVIACELVAIPVNPFPQWNYEHGIEQEENRLKALMKTLGLSKDTTTEDKK